ncbi:MULTISPECIES: hypothetical protein [Cytobacillus]|uniref:Uncharacterized protein n=1 Tax=Cytobacillus horneckiae TaxID=549687 RepID=A0A2N0Z998_9BACI|nr:MULTISPECIES: hypothetical protein [Cytobacillus]MDK7667356.1 hypothetical protein [Cytobacillus oceanisediminis]MEC1157793.1 hypothetical protein [Cytobacillus horneckiae]PKG26082.1 hypothetical protein CWS20_25920 [Cytobacillus horneckiae]
MKTIIQTILKGKEAARKEQLNKLVATGDKHLVMFNRFNQAKEVKEGQGWPVKQGDVFAVYNGQTEFVGTVQASGQLVNNNY